MAEIIGVRFKSGGKQYYFDPQGIRVQEGQEVIVETSRGVEYGECVQPNIQMADEAIVQPLRPVLRIATEEDKKTLIKNREKEEKAFQICQEKIIEHGLEMKLVDTEYSFEGNKVLFFFTAEGRVDFRALVKDLASTIHARIELRQIGVRDEAKMLGGLGICGRPFCCSQFLDDFQPVSIKMAKTQNLSLNPTKISGTCGRLMCCLKYEQDAYEDLVKHTPKQDSFVETPDGAGTVSSVNLLRQQVQVRLESDPDTPHCYHNCEVCVVRSGKGKRPEGYIQPPLEELEKLRKPKEEEIPEPTRAPVSPLAAALEAVFNGEVPNIEGDQEGRRGRSNRRNNKKERTQREEAPNTVKSEKPEKPEKAERPKGEKSRPERPKNERSERQERPKNQKPPQKQNGERLQRPARPERAERPERTEKPRTEKPVRKEGVQPGTPDEQSGEIKRFQPRRRPRKPRPNGGKPQSGEQES